MNDVQPRPLDRRSPMPLWAQLHDDLTRRAASGAFDDAFPGELDLAAEYEVSRHTVREALRRMREQGLLDSTRGRATRLRAGIEQPLGSLYSLFRQVEALGMVQASVVRDQRFVLDPAAAARLDLPPTEQLFHLERLRLIDGEPLAHDEVWLVADLGRSVLDADFGRTALYDELAVRAGVRLTGGCEKITAVTPSAEQCDLLQLPRGAACLRVERLGLLQHRAVEFRVSVVRGDRYTVVADWSNRGYQVRAETVRAGGSRSGTAPAETGRPTA